MACEVLSVQSALELREDMERVRVRPVTEHPEPGEGCSSSGETSSQHLDLNHTEDKENGVHVSTTVTRALTQADHTTGQDSCWDARSTASKQDIISATRDPEVLRQAQEEDRVDVVLSGSVTPDGCCRFVGEILKCILYQRQQLPMTYDELVYSQKKQQTLAQDKDTVSRRPPSISARKRQQTLQELEELLQQLEVLFTLSKVPRVLLLMGGSLNIPKELYEINMEGLVLAGGDQCLRASSCLRQIFRTLFVADFLSDTKPVRLMSTTVLALAHRDCGVSWFRSKLQFKVPTRVKNQVIALSSDPSTNKGPWAEGPDRDDYVWFQAPVSIKGFSS
ncbi:unnamed protein product [Ophioblennius macclurei]